MYQSHLGKKILVYERMLYKSHLGKNFTAMLGGQSELGSTLSCKAVWSDLHLASVLTQLFSCLLVWSNSKMQIDWWWERHHVFAVELSCWTSLWFTVRPTWLTASWVPSCCCRRRCHSNTLSLISLLLLFLLQISAGKSGQIHVCL